MNVHYLYNGLVCVMEFKNKEIMKAFLEKNANKYEGFIKDRQGYNYRNGKEYVIGYVIGDIDTKKHELLHAKYFADANYRKEIKKLWASLSSGEQDKVIKVLTDLGYPKKVHLDEFQAYLNSERNPKRFFGLKIKI